MRTERKSLIWGQFLFAVGALWLHWRIHPYMVIDPLTGTSELHLGKLVAFIICLVDIFVVTTLFMSPKTSFYGYLLNGMLVIFGSVMMSHFSIALLIDQKLPFDVWFWKSTLPDIILAAGDFMIGKGIYEISVKELLEGS